MAKISNSGLKEKKFVELITTTDEQEEKTNHNQITFKKTKTKQPSNKTGKSKDGCFQSGSISLASVTLVAFAFGTGGLSLPFAISQLGLIPGLVLFFFTAFSMHFMLEMLTESALKLKNFNLSELIEVSIGKTLLMIYNIMIIISGIGDIMSYIITPYQLIQDFIFTIFNIDTSKYIILIYLLGFFLFQLPLCLKENISKIQFVSSIATLLIILIFILIGCEAPFYYYQNIKDKLQIKLYSPIGYHNLSSIAILMFSYCNHYGLLNILEQFNNPTLPRCLKVVRIGTFIETISYFIVAFGGYISTLDKTPPIFISREDIRGFSPDYIILVIKFFLAICLVCLIPLRWTILRESAKSICGIKQLSFKQNFIFTFLSLMIINIIVYHINIIIILEFGGGICIVLISFIIPFFTYLYSFEKKSSKMKVFLGIILLIIFSIFGVSATIDSIIKGITQLEKN